MVTAQEIKEIFAKKNSSKTLEFLQVYPQLLEKIVNNAEATGSKVFILEIGNRNYETLDAILSISRSIYAIGIDVMNKSDLNKEQRDRLLETHGDRVELVAASQHEKDVLFQICQYHWANFGGFDLVIDDGSHVDEFTLSSFDLLSSYMKEEGVYVIEDTEVMYYPEPDPDSLTEFEYWRVVEDYHGNLTLKSFITGLLDVLNRDYARRGKLRELFKDGRKIPRRRIQTVGRFTLLGRDDKIASYRVYPNCLVLYFGYSKIKSSFIGGPDPVKTKMLF